MTTLKDNLSSDYLGAFAKLKPKKAPKNILVYVESYEDIAFWRSILMSFENQQIQFDIQLPSKTTLAKGKNKALQKTNEIFEYIPLRNLGNYLLICVDSDYDYLLKDYSEYSKIINSNDFIFQTYSYSIENLKCYAESLHSICVSATLNDKVLINFSELMKTYSNIVYDLFLWNLFFYKTGDFCTFTLKMFCNIIKVLEEPKIDEFGKSALVELSIRVNQKIEELEIAFADNIEDVKKLGTSLLELGLNQENAYLFIQGHTIFDNVVLMFLKPICKQLKTEHEITIKKSAKHEAERTYSMNQYHNQIKMNKVEVLLSNNTEFKQIFLYQKIKSDLEHYINNLSN